MQEIKDKIRCRLPLAQRKLEEARLAAEKAKKDDEEAAKRVDIPDEWPPKDKRDEMLKNVKPLDDKEIEDLVKAGHKDLNVMKMPETDDSAEAQRKLDEEELRSHIVSDKKTPPPDVEHEFDTEAESPDTVRVTQEDITFEAEPTIPPATPTKPPPSPETPPKDKNKPPTMAADGSVSGTIGEITSWFNVRVDENGDPIETNGKYDFIEPMKDDGKRPIPQSVLDSMKSTASTTPTGNLASPSPPSLDEIPESVPISEDKDKILKKPPRKEEL